MPMALARRPRVTRQDGGRAVLSSVCGSKINKSMCDLLAQEKPGEKSYQELVKLIQNHLAPTSSEII